LDNSLKWKCNELISEFFLCLLRWETLTISLNGVNAPRGQISCECQGNNDRMLSVEAEDSWGLISVDSGATIERGAAPDL